MGISTSQQGRTTSCQKMIFLIVNAGISTSSTAISHAWSARMVLSQLLEPKFRNPDQCYSKESKLTLSLSILFIFQLPPFTREKKWCLSWVQEFRQSHLNALQVAHCEVRPEKEIWESSHSFGLIGAVLWHFINLMVKDKAESLLLFWKSTAREGVTAQEKTIKNCL